MKNFKKVALLMAILMVVCVIAAACENTENLKGVTEDTIWVGNTAGTTGALASIGEPFNLGIEAAFAVYNANGGFKGQQQVKLKHYDDGSEPTASKTLTEKLLHEDEVFAIVGDFGTSCISANLPVIKEAGAPMVYAAAGNDELFNENAKGADRYIIPVQPLSKTEGRSMILRAFTSVENGGLGATKVGVLSNNVDASQSMLAGIKAEENSLTAAQKANIVYQNVAATSGGDYSAAIAKFKNDECDLVIVALIGAEFLSALKTMDNANYYPDVLTSFNSANASNFYVAEDSVVLNPEYESILTNANVYAQAWLDITSTTYFYKNEGELYDGYKALAASLGAPNAYDFGVPGFTEDYWVVAENIYNYAKSINRTDAFAMSYNSYALAGYIAGDMFCQGLKALEDSEKELTRANYVDVMESADLRVAMARPISYANGLRAGVEDLALNKFVINVGYDTTTWTPYKTPAMTIVSGLKGIDELREAVK